MRQLIEGIAPSQDAVEEALAQIESAVSYYVGHYVDNNGSGITINGIVRKTRKGLLELDKHLVKALRAAQGLSYKANALLDQAGPGGSQRLIEGLRQAHAAVAEAKELAMRLPNKQPDGARTILAMHIGLVFVEVMQRTPSKTRDEAGIDHHPRDGAAFARVLREALVMAGAERVDLGPEIDQGLLLLWAILAGKAGQQVAPPAQDT